MLTQDDERALKLGHFAMALIYGLAIFGGPLIFFELVHLLFWGSLTWD